MMPLGLVLLVYLSKFTHTQTHTPFTHFNAELDPFPFKCCPTFLVLQNQGYVILLLLLLDYPLFLSNEKGLAGPECFKGQRMFSAGRRQFSSVPSNGARLKGLQSMAGGQKEIVYLSDLIN